MQDFSSTHAVFEKLNRERKYRWPWFVVSRSPLVAPIQTSQSGCCPRPSDTNGGALESISGVTILHERPQAESLGTAIGAFGPQLVGYARFAFLSTHSSPNRIAVRANSVAWLMTFQCQLLQTLLFLQQVLCLCVD